MGLGWGQTWQEVTSSRAVNTSYQNTTGRPIVFTVNATPSSYGALQVSVDNTNWVTAAVSSNPAITSAIVPPNQYYRFGTTVGMIYWAELR